ncbi:MAG: J domain-containing protein [Salinisphaera sp.]|jgi:curved DNA-binding protein CbpA|nr:J domain-containing protein [Salinisphaera sp.]
MSDPYKILDMTPEAADDDTVRRAYLDGLRTHSPERDPAGFQRLRDAYEQIASHRRRIAHALFHAETPNTTDLAVQLLAPGTPRRPSVDAVRAALAAGLKSS